MTTRLILVGGFLGSGKTSLLWEAAQRLRGAGQRVGLITNDQAPELVDTAFLSRDGVTVTEVSGSCFCCNFPGLLDAMAQARVKATADVLIAEPVGSCTDLSATIVQPLKELHRGDLVVAPLSVLADPQRLTEIIEGGNSGLHPSAAYIFRKQLEESDLIVVSKADLLAPDRRAALKLRTEQVFPQASVLFASAKTGEGVDVWLGEVMRRADAGRRIVEVDYEIYAEGEAVLGWLNATFLLRGCRPSWDAFAQEFLRGLSERFERTGATVGHVKLYLESAGNGLIANLTGGADTLSLRGTAGRAPEAKLTLNARVQMPPDALESAVRAQLDATGRGWIETHPIAWRCLSPGRPTPTHRYDHVFTPA